MGEADILGRVGVMCLLLQRVEVFHCVRQIQWAVLAECIEIVQ